jgi:hypothetical protein
MACFGIPVLLAVPSAAKVTVKSCADALLLQQFPVLIGPVGRSRSKESQLVSVNVVNVGSATGKQ